MTMISYAQNHEDVLLDRAFPRGKPGFYIDVGANDPVTDSVTKHFYDLGWHGINVEPARQPFEALAAARSRDINVNIGLSNTEGELEFFEFPIAAASTFDAEQARRNEDTGVPAERRTVPTWTLAQLCERYVTGPIDFLSVDVESHEREVLEGGDWTRFRPRIVLVESTQPNTTIPSHERWEGILLAARYRFAFFDGLNRYYVAEEEADLAPALGVPANVTDDYIPWRYHMHIEHERAGYNRAAGLLAAAEAVNGALLAQCRGFTEELASLRAHYERLERMLTAARSQAEEELRAYGPETPILPEGASPASLSVARQLTALSARHPKASSAVKKTLRAGLQAKRSLTSRTGES
jgi:FkbM family methyltransferase